jgi:hypothetical protein
MARRTTDLFLFAPGARWRRRTAPSQGSILLLTVIVLCLLSLLLLLATNSVLLGTRARESVGDALAVFYIAEAGLSHGQAFCRACGEQSPVLAGEFDVAEEAGNCEVDVPFDAWLPFSDGRYRIRAYPLSTVEQPYVERDSGILLVSTGELEGKGRKRICLLLDEPPSCSALAWWTPE